MKTDKYTSAQIQETWQSSSRIKSKETPPRDIVAKLSAKWKFLKQRGEKELSKKEEEFSISTKVMDGRINRMEFLKKATQMLKFYTKWKYPFNTKANYRHF